MRCPIPYSTKTECDLVLAQALTTSNPSSTDPIKLINIGNERNLNLVTDTTVESYIIYSDSLIDGILSQQYATPLKKLQLNEYTITTCTVGDATVVLEPHGLLAGDSVVIRCEATGLYEYHTVLSIVDSTTIELTTPLADSDLLPSVCPTVYLAKIGYPFPINQISSRYAASFIYDKYFAAQASPNISDYGKEMRAIAMQQLNDILNGKIILSGQLRIGDRFGNAWLSDTYALQDRGFATSERNMSKLG